MAFHVPEKYRLTTGLMQSNPGYGNNGAFIVTLAHKQTVRIIASDACGWEHVSVSRKDRCPTWAEMCQVKNLFWDDTDCVIQYHPPKSEYINNHPFCLHLWRPIGQPIPLPDSILVGV